MMSSLRKKIAPVVIAAGVLLVTNAAAEYEKTCPSGNDEAAGICGDPITEPFKLLVQGGTADCHDVEDMLEAL